mgnify:FL=1
MTFDLAKPIMTRDGQPVEIITTKGRYPEFPIVGYIGSSEYLELWALDGSNRNVRGRADLVNVPEPKRVVDFWVNVYPDYRGNVATHTTKEDANYWADDTCADCFHIRWTEGKGAEVIND